MKHLLSCLVLSAAFVCPLAAADAGKNTANSVILKKDELKNKAVTLDVTMVTRLPVDVQKAQEVGAIVFVVHTWDKQNNFLGGHMVVAVAKEKADAFAKKYGTAVDVGDAIRKGVETKTLKANLVLLPKSNLPVLDVDGKVLEAFKAGKGDPIEDAVREADKDGGKTK